MPRLDILKPESYIITEQPEKQEHKGYKLWIF